MSGTVTTALTDAIAAIGADVAAIKRSLALDFGERSQTKNIGPLIYAVLNPPTIAAACAAAARYLHVHNQALQLRLEVGSHLARFAFSYANMAAVNPR